MSVYNTITPFQMARHKYFTIEQFIFYFLWDHWTHCGIFENGVLLMYTLERVRSVANFITAYEESQ